MYPEERRFSTSVKFILFTIQEITSGLARGGKTNTKRKRMRRQGLQEAKLQLGRRETDRQKRTPPLFPHPFNSPNNTKHKTQPLKPTLIRLSVTTNNFNSFFENDNAGEISGTKLTIRIVFHLTLHAYKSSQLVN
jgi:hypothetical protein